MRLTELSPRWYGRKRRVDDTDVAEYGRTGIGVSFECPHCFNPSEGASLTRISVPFANPLDGGPSEPNANGCAWQRTGDAFETLTLTPSVNAEASGHWHGFITNGEVT